MSMIKYARNSIPKNIVFPGSKKNQEEHFGKKFDVTTYYNKVAWKIYEMFIICYDYYQGSTLPFLGFPINPFVDPKNKKLAPVGDVWKELFTALTMDDYSLLSSILYEVAMEGKDITIILFLKKQDGTFQLLLGFEGYKPSSSIVILHGCSVTTAIKGNGDIIVRRVCELSPQEIEELNTNHVEEVKETDFDIKDGNQFPTLDGSSKVPDVTPAVSPVGTPVGTPDGTTVNSAEAFTHVVSSEVSSHQEESTEKSAAVLTMNSSEIKEEISTLEAEISDMKKLLELRKQKEELKEELKGLLPSSGKQTHKKPTRSSWDTDSDEENEVDNAVKALEEESVSP